jgi:hypothetical protein
MKTLLQRNLPKAHMYEEAVASRFRDKGWNVEMAPDKYFPDYDMIVERDGISTTIECKVDYCWNRTGNICCEFMQELSTGQIVNSGICAGNINDYVIYLLPDKQEKNFQYFIMRKSKLIELCKTHHKKIVDNPEHTARCWILPTKYLKLKKW